MILSLLGVAVGGLITYCVSRSYYEKASSDLKAEAARLRNETRRVRARLVDLFAALDEAGLIDVEWDETGGDILGVRITRTMYSEIHAKRAEPDEETTPERGAGEDP